MRKTRISFVFHKRVEDEFRSKLQKSDLYSFNGIETEYLWHDSEIVQAFKSIFGKIQTETKKFRGTGLSEGEQ